MSRRELIRGLGTAAVGLYLRPFASLAHTLSNATAPTAPVAVARCSGYGPGVQTTLATVFDQLGGLQRLVRGKTVAIKLNLTGEPSDKVRGMPRELTHWVHPAVVGATVSLLGQAGARRIRLLESTLSPSGSFEEFVSKANWNPRDFSSAASGVEFEDTNYAGQAGKYTRLTVPGGGMLFKAYDVNHSYADCDIYVSLAKLKEHATAGVTLSMKNSFGIPPCTIYGEGAGVNEPSKLVRGSRSMLHDGSRQPSKTAFPENDPNSPRDPGYRVPRVTVDLAMARPIHLAVIDGIATVAGGEGPWVSRCRPLHAGLLIAGTNCVTVDAVSTALMGFDPTADRGTAPFEGCDSTLKLAERLGIGTRDLSRIEVIGVPVSKAKISFRSA
ncbi:MAG TPA: DUF362 domain-containing protein [Terriglobia bacterium]